MNNIEKNTFAGIVSKIALFFSIYSVVAAVLILHFRHWAPEILKQTMGVLAYPVFLFGIVAIAIQKWGKNVWILPSALLLFMFLPFFIKLTGVWILLPMGFLGISLTAWSCRLTKEFYSLSEFIQLLVISFALAVFYFFVVNGSRYAHIFADIALLKGVLHIDTLFHSAITNMLVRFGVPSMGLDGIPQIVYHVAVHRWVASNLSVLGGNTSVLMAISQQVVFLSAMFFSFIFVISFLVLNPAFIITIITFFFGIFWLAASRLWDSYLVSESYTFSLAIFIAMIPVGRSWFERSFQGRLLDVIKPREIGFAIVVIAVCGLAKVSSASVLAVYLVVCILIPQFLRDPGRMAIFILAVIGPILLAASAIIFFYFGGTLLYQFYPFHFARARSEEFIWECIVFVSMISSFWFISSLSDKEFRGPFAIVLLVTFLIGQVPGALLKIGGGGYYFSHTALLITLIFGITAFAGVAFSKIGKRWQYFFSYVILTVALVTVLKISPKVLNLRYERRISEFWGESQIYRKEDVIFEDTTLCRVQKLVSGLGLSSTNKDVVIYIPPSYEAFWNGGRKVCWARPLVVPAFIGLPLLNGVRTGLDSCDIIKTYGMGDYQASSRNYELSEKDICYNAKKAGFKKVYEISENAGKMHLCN